ncbi:S-layer homology domain-containing protein [Enorma phocaeensis]|uniref:S-layer homology domain-containing protein n=1 Tax=Enorma phocaeensis TaxID=1871019 RepID=A0ABT7VBN2_9ACTN|nr:S-layer homology domain-containing protein [Enorma phocaeensis]MDM8275794.1 S-layer homology domain-containing protein [Enorma phocaeensis]
MDRKTRRPWSVSGGAIRACLALMLALGFIPAVPVAYATESVSAEAVFSDEEVSTPASTPESSNVVELGEGTTRLGLRNKLQAANGGTVKLTADLTFTDSTSSIDLGPTANAVLDLNGHTINWGAAICNIKIGQGSKLTIIDSSETGNGAIVQMGTTAGTSVIECMGSLTIQGGSVLGPGCAIFGKTANANITIAGGSVSSTGTRDAAIKLFGGTATVSGAAHISGTLGIVLQNSDEDNTEQSAHAKLSVSGGVIEAQHFAISGNNQKSAQCSATITGGEISSSEEAAIYWPMEGQLTISSGSLSGASVIEAKMGNITISGGNLTARGSKSSSVMGGGSISDGSVVKIVGQSYGTASGQYIDNPDLTVMVEGGVLVSEHGNAVSVYNEGETGDTGVDGPACTVTVRDDASIVPASGCDAMRVVSTDGAFSFEGNKVTNGNTTVTNTALAQSAAKVSTLTTTDANGSDTKPTMTLCSGVESAVAEAYATGAAATGATVTLLKNDAGDISIPEGENVTIDFNSHTLVGTINNQGKLTFNGTGGFAGQVIGDQPSSSGSGTVAHYIAQVGGSFYTTLDGAVDAAEEGSTIVLLDDATVAPLTLDQSVTIDGQGHTVTMDANSTGGSFITVLSGNVAVKNATINASEASHGIQFYCAENGSLENVTITGGTGTSLMVNGSDVTVKNCSFGPEDGAWANIEFAMGGNVTAVPSLSVQGSSNYDSNLPFVYVDVHEGETLDRIRDNVAGLRGASASQVAEWLNDNKLEGVYLRVSADGAVSAPSPGEKPAPRPPVVVKPTFDISAAPAENGSIDISDSSAKEGETVTITVKPDEGFELDELTVLDEDGEAVAITENADGSYSFKMPKADVTVTASFACDGGELCPSHCFTDFDSTQWYHEAIDWAVTEGVLSGIGGTTLMMPDGDITRAQMAQVLWNIEGHPLATADDPFSDVSEGDWFYNSVSWAAQAGIFTGYDGIFDPDGKLTREQAAAVLMRWASVNGEDVSGRADLSTFPDADGVSDWAVESVQWAVDAGVISGIEHDDGTLTIAAQGTATRAQVAALMMRLLKA